MVVDKLILTLLLGSLCTVNLQFAHDTKHLNLPLAVFFVKNFGPEMLAIVSRKQKLGSGEESATLPTNGGSEAAVDTEYEAQKISEGFVTKEQQAMFRNLLTEYFKGVEKHLVRDHEVRISTFVGEYEDSFSVNRLIYKL